MALPILETPENKGQVQEIISDIATAVFKSAKISMESAAKMVVPSVPEMVDEVLDDLKSGSIQKFNLAMDKLDKLVNKLGIDLKQYNKELANFAARREEKIIKSEEKIQLLKEKNIVAEIEKSGDIKILSNRDIETKKDNLKLLEKNIAKLEKSLEKDRKLLQESDKLKTRAQANKKEEVKHNVLKLDDMKKERETEKQILGERGEQQPGILQRGREGVGNFVEEYVPQPIADVGNAMVEGFMAPINAVKDLGKSFGQLLKPLKLLRPLFTGLLGGLKKFALGLKTGFIAMLPQIALGAVILTVLGLIYLAIKKIRDFLGIDSPKENIEQKAKKQAEAGNLRQSGNIKESIKEKPEFLDSRGDVIKFGEAKTVEEIEKDFKPQTEMPESFKKEIRPGSYWDKIQKMDNRSGDLKKQENREKLKMPDNLTPISSKEKEQKINSVIDSSVKSYSSVNTTVTGLNGIRDRDMEILNLQIQMYP